MKRFFFYFSFFILQSTVSNPFTYISNIFNKTNQKRKPQEIQTPKEILNQSYDAIEKELNNLIAQIDKKITYLTEEITRLKNEEKKLKEKKLNLLNIEKSMYVQLKEKLKNKTPTQDIAKQMYKMKLIKHNQIGLKLEVITFLEYDPTDGGFDPEILKSRGISDVYRKTCLDEATQKMIEKILNEHDNDSTKQDIPLQKIIKEHLLKNKKYKEFVNAFDDIRLTHCISILAQLISIDYSTQEYEKISNNQLTNCIHDQILGDHDDVSSIYSNNNISSFYDSQTENSQQELQFINSKTNSDVSSLISFGSANSFGSVDSTAKDNKIKIKAKPEKTNKTKLILSICIPITLILTVWLITKHK